MRQALRRVAAALVFCVLPASSEAQQGRYNRVTATQRSTVDIPVAPRERTRSDAFRPYGARSSGYSADGQYHRAQRELPPQTRPTRPVVVERSTNYYPGMRNGQAPNSNTPPARHICVPGRRSLMYR